jgi:hypothetical protein
MYGNLINPIGMNEVESRRVVPMAQITVICTVLLALFELYFISTAYELKASTVKKVAPWVYEPYRKMMGEHPSTQPKAARAPASNTPDSAPSGVATVAGFKPEELTITIEDAKMPVPEVEPAPVIPVSTPKMEPVDENEPVG